MKRATKVLLVVLGIAVMAYGLCELPSLQAEQPASIMLAQYYPPCPLGGYGGGGYGGYGGGYGQGGYQGPYPPQGPGGPWGPSPFPGGWGPGAQGPCNPWSPYGQGFPNHGRRW